MSRTRLDPEELVDYVIVRTAYDYDELRELIPIALQKDQVSNHFVRKIARKNIPEVVRYLEKYEDNLVMVELIAVKSHAVNQLTLEERIEQHLAQAQRQAEEEAKRKAEEKAISDAKNLLKQKGLL